MSHTIVPERVPCSGIENGNDTRGLARVSFVKGEEEKSR
jgi:hypothetical protein